jgi:AraC-like DNA-binding protein
MDPVLDSLRASVLVARRSELGPAWRQPSGLDPYGRLYYVESGRGWLRLAGRDHAFRPRHFFVVPAQVRHEFGCPKHMVMRWCHFTATVLGGIDLFSYVACAHELSPERTRHVPGLLRRLAEVCSHAAPGWELASRGLLLELLALFVATARSGADLGARRRLLAMAPALAYVDEHIDEPIRVPALARVVGLQGSYFSRAFTAAIGTGPARYVVDRKIERAQRMLVEDDATLETIAHRLSFVDAFHLSKTFKRIVGVSPREFRARAARAGP